MRKRPTHQLDLKLKQLCRTYPEYIKMTELVPVSDRELRRTAWTKECPKFIAGKKKFKPSLHEKALPYLYQTSTFQKTLPPSRISQEKVYDTTHCARKKIIDGKEATFYDSLDMVLEHMVKDQC